MKIVLVMLKNLQSYIFDNIQHLKHHDNSDITVITVIKNSIRCLKIMVSI